MQTPGVPTPPGSSPGVAIYTAAQVREAEAPFLERGVPLMARAAAALANEAATLLDEYRGGVAGARVLVLAGSGNNGGDALYAAAALAARGAAVSVLPTSDRLHQRALEAVLEAGAALRPQNEPADVIAALARSAAHSHRRVSDTCEATSALVLTYRLCRCITVPFDCFCPQPSAPSLCPSSPRPLCTIFVSRRPFLLRSA